MVWSTSGYRRQVLSTESTVEKFYVNIRDILFSIKINTGNTNGYVIMCSVFLFYDIIDNPAVRISLSEDKTRMQAVFMFMGNEHDIIPVQRLNGDEAYVLHQNDMGSVLGGLNRVEV